VNLVADFAALMRRGMDVGVRVPVVEQHPKRVERDVDVVRIRDAAMGNFSLPSEAQHSRLKRTIQGWTQTMTPLLRRTAAYWHIACGFRRSLS
jgi:hypothetical protein